MSSSTRTPDGVDRPDIHDTKTYLRLRALDRLGKAVADFPYFSSGHILKDLKGNRRKIHVKSLNRYLYDLTKEGVIFGAGRGWYSALAEPFALNREPVHGLVEVLEARFPLLDFSCWSTAQLAPFAHHQIVRSTQFVYTDDDAMQSVAEALRNADVRAYVDPKPAEIGKHVQLADNVVIIRPAITQSPVDEENPQYAPIEKVLVDLYWEANGLQIMDEAERRRIVESIIRSGRISLATMLRYQTRRKVPKIGLSF